MRSDLDGTFSTHVWTGRKSHLDGINRGLSHISGSLAQYLSTHSHLDDVRPTASSLTMTSNVATTIDLFKSKFPGKVITPGNVEYEAAKTHPWSQTCWTPAAAYLQPSSAEEVAQSLQVIQQRKCRFAVRTTGHNPNLGFSSTDETGIVLDLCQLKSKELTPGNIARVGAGNIWGEVYSWLEDHQLSAVGGRDQQVGLPGFLLGGMSSCVPMPKRDMVLRMKR